MRDHLKHKAFRQAEMAKSDRVVWKFPKLDKIEFGNMRTEDVVARVKEDSTHPVSIEVARLMRLYVEAFRLDLIRLAKHYNSDRVPQVGITRDEPRNPVEHVAQHLAAVFIQEQLIDATEEEPLLHPAKQ